MRETIMRMKRKLLRECKEVIGNVRFEKITRWGTAFVLLKFFLENLFRLFEPFLLQVCGNVAENFFVVHYSITISNSHSNSKPLCASRISESQWKFVSNLSLGFSVGLVLLNQIWEMGLGFLGLGCFEYKASLDEYLLIVKHAWEFLFTPSFLFLHPCLSILNFSLVSFMRNSL